ncbi:MAG TPA: YkgJ family cysteine cluster protein [Candidatus Acidoferrales bacterium]|nr:YkgJ family cysteine cluster protein [Candidatus Acidoferrales bacterium]
MTIDLVQIRILGEKKREENFRFRRFMKSRDHSDRILRRIAEGIQEQIDCRQCANCCRVATAKVAERDVDRLARHFRLKPERIMADYVVEDAEEGFILRRRESGECVFLDGNDCTVYEARPEVCQRYPHLVRGNGSIASRMWSIVDRAGVCPIVYHSLEAFKEHMGFRR